VYLLGHFALVFDPKRFARSDGNDRIGLHIVAGGAEHLPVVLAVVAVLVIARDDVIDFDANPTGQAAGPAAIAFGSDSGFGLAGKLLRRWGGYRHYVAPPSAGEPHLRTTWDF
jgi:hypothetical protein